ncbi:hypothetical protein NDU88_003822 [Pleurodeles waltl]|uniref:Uncharacterized protein n=1 Tax=Pleurodeles waltl TaxID=8319 RepID=A0AAV7SH03_PLEWA|nr:hypothetical protein NDU88_003822 [Pleurodeles waltl]
MVGHTRGYSRQRTDSFPAPQKLQAASTWPRDFPLTEERDARGAGEAWLSVHWRGELGPLSALRQAPGQ